MSAVLHTGDEGALESVGYPFAAPVDRSCVHTLRTASAVGARVELALTDLVLRPPQPPPETPENASSSASAAGGSGPSALGAIATGGTRLSRRSRLAWLSRLLRNCSDMLLVLYKYKYSTRTAAAVLHSLNVLVAGAGV